MKAAAVRARALLVPIAALLIGLGAGAALGRARQSTAEPPAAAEAAPVATAASDQASGASVVPHLEPPLCCGQEPAATSVVASPAAIDVPGRHPALTALLDRSRADRIAPDITSQLPRLDDADEIAAVAALLADPTELDTVRHEAANLLRRSEDPVLVERLAAAVADPRNRERFRSFAVQHIGLLIPEAAWAHQHGTMVRHLRAALADRQVAVRREALLPLAGLRDEQAAAFVAANLDAPGIADLCVRCAQIMDRRELLPRIRQLADQCEPVTQLAALDALVLWRDQESLPAFLRARAADNRQVRAVGERGMQALTGL